MPKVQFATYASGWSGKSTRIFCPANVLVPFCGYVNPPANGFDQDPPTGGVNGRPGGPSVTKFETNVPEPKSVAAAFRPLLAALIIAPPVRITVFGFN